MRQYIVSATAMFGGILVMAATSILPDSRARAADECLAAPKGSAPQGSRWYYRTDRATQRKCWFLSEPGAKASASAAAPATPPIRLPPERPKRQPDATAGVAPAAKAKPNELDAKAYAITPLVGEASGDATSGQATSREDQSAADQLVTSALLERGQALMSVAQSDGAAKSSADDEMPSVWPVLARDQSAETNEAPSSPIRFASLLVFLAGVLASAIFAARAILKRSRRVRVDRAVYPSRLAPLAPQDDASRLAPLAPQHDASRLASHAPQHDASRLAADGADARLHRAVRRAPQDDGGLSVPRQRRAAA